MCTQCVLCVPTSLSISNIEIDMGDNSMPKHELHVSQTEPAVKKKNYILKRIELATRGKDSHKTDPK